jgi:membrane-bound lytic murein transglycosylase D
MRMNLRHLYLPGLAVPALLLAGCVPHQPAETPAAEEPQATAPALPAAARQAPRATAFAPQALTLEQQRVRLLIQQVESAYARGNADYRKGKLPEAKQEFDRAVDLMLMSGIDIRSNAQLQEEFDRILDGVNGLEMEALKQGNGFVSKEETTPGEAASDVTFVVDPNVVAKAKSYLATTRSDLPLVVNDYVASYINFFANTQRGHNTLLHSFQRAGRYKMMIQRVMAEEGVPQDLIYLAVAESSFQPRALNAQSGAGGMWQFMPHGNYGLVRNQYVDERFDPEKSTRAYARYMKFIYDQTGDWYLTMAGYNWGTGNVQRAVEKTGYADFWELYKRHNLPAETQNYVPEILAAIIIANHPTQYGFDEITLDPPVLTDTVTINYPVDLRLVSDLVGAPVNELQALNPSLLHMITPPDTPFDLHLPGGTATLFGQRVASIPESRRVGWRYHRVTAGDTLASVAREYRVTEEALAGANQLRESNSIEGVEGLAIPAAAPVAAAAAAGASAPPVAHARVYTARRGDTLVTIADRYGVSLNQLRRWNEITGTLVRPGRRLYVADPDDQPRAAVHDQPRSEVRGHHRGGLRAETETRETAPASSARDKSNLPRGHRKSGAAEERKLPVQRGESDAGSSARERSTLSRRGHRRTETQETALGSSTREKSIIPRGHGKGGAAEEKKQKPQRGESAAGTRKSKNADERNSRAPVPSAHSRTHGHKQK